MRRNRRMTKFIAFVCFLAVLCVNAGVHAMAAEKSGAPGEKSVRAQYEEYRARLENIETFSDI